MLSVFLSLLVAHVLCDYPLQGDFLARGKNQRNPIPGIPWYHCAVAHSLIHAGAVWFLTHSILLGAGEFAAHFVIDYLKCAGKTTYNFDQFLHVFCKLLWSALVVTFLF